MTHHFANVSVRGFLLKLVLKSGLNVRADNTHTRIMFKTYAKTKLSFTFFKHYCNTISFKDSVTLLFCHNCVYGKTDIMKLSLFCTTIVQSGKMTKLQISASSAFWFI